MTDNEIIKTLECCTTNSCNGCPIDELKLLGTGNCISIILTEALDYIKRQKAEVKKIKTDLKYYLDTNEENGVVYIPKCIIDNIVKEMTEKDFR